jgi:hypothetical protein
LRSPPRAGGIEHAGSEVIILAKLIAASSLLVIAAGAFVGYSQMQYERMGDALNADIATYRRQRWERPVLRGEAKEGNAALTILTQLANLRDLGVQTRDHLAAQLYYGQPLDAGQQALIAEHDTLIAALREATNMSWAMTELPVEQGAAAQVPAYPRVMDAVLLMLGKAAASEDAGTCLQICSDVMRMGQDLVPGAPLEAASVSMRITSVSSPVVAHCAERADLEALARASHELSILASHAPPAGGGIELADLLTRVELHKLAELSPPNSSDSLVTRLRRRPALFEAFERFGNPTRWRNIAADHYPDARESWLQEHSSRSRSDLPLVASATREVDGWLFDDMRGQALLRTLTVGTSTLAERMRRKKLPREPMGLDEPSLRDPYNGQPLKWRLTQDGSELSVWSVGEDLRDDKGASEWGEQAPLDVVVHFRLRSLEPLDPKRGPRPLAANGHAAR